jgi:hypothetical protein
MSQLERLKEQRSNGKKPGTKQATSDPGIFNWKPSESVKMLFKANGFTLDQALTVLDDRVNCGLKISISFNQRGNAISVIVRDGAVPWQEGEAVAVNHSDLAKALLAMGYYLGEVNPGFPSSPAQPGAMEFDW